MMKSENKSLRLFYALWPDDATRAALMDVQAPLAGRKTRYENLHMTLAFLGQQPADLLPALTAILAKLPRQSIPLTIDRIGYFTQKKIAWAGMHETSPALTDLNRHLLEALAQNKVAFSSASEFRPHVTLARDADAPEELPFQPFAWTCRHVALVESSNRVDGVHYQVLASHFLTQG